MNTSLLRRIGPDEVPTLRRDPVDAETLAATAGIVEDVRTRGVTALREHAERFGDLRPGEPLIREGPELQDACRSLDVAQRGLLERTAGRIRAFAEAQRRCLTDLSFPIVGGTASHTAEPVQRVGCYAPAGRYPLPSSILMTAVTARVAGVEEVWVASPRPTALTLAAAAVAGADTLLAVGGVQAIAALAYGAGLVPPCDVVVGPGNRWVTAAKKLVAGPVSIDMLAGPSELVILADGSADPAVVAADLLAQAEHDADALPILVTLDGDLAVAVERELGLQLRELPTAVTARAALANGFVVFAESIEAAVALCDRLAPEHLHVVLRDGQAVVHRLRHYGALFIGASSGEILGDYGAGPNHVLPTGGTARSTGGLSVLSFLRLRTCLRIDDPAAAKALAEDAAGFARLEGLEAHARAAEHRTRPLPQGGDRDRFPPARHTDDEGR